MQVNYRLLPAIALAIATTFIACKKDSVPAEADQATEVKTHTEDQQAVSSNLDDIATEADAALEASASFGGRTQKAQDDIHVCGATVSIDTAGATRSITVTYNGPGCRGDVTRTGSVVLSMPAGVRWRNAGATVTLTYHDLKITRTGETKSIIINGTQTFTNVSGGLVKNLPNSPNIVHTITSDNMSITFDNGTQRKWNIARKRTYSYQNGIVLSIRGFGTTGSVTNAAEWGTNRFGHAFITSIAEPLVFRQDCGFRLTSGQIKHEGVVTATIIFGLDSTGIATTCPGAGHYYYKLTWTGSGGNSQTVILPY